MSYWVYFVRCADQSVYAGSTVDLNRRIHTHNEGKGAKYTRGRRPVVLAQAWQVPTQRQALRLEAGLKMCRRTFKEELIKNPQKIREWANRKGYQFPINMLEGENKNADCTN